MSIDGCESTFEDLATKILPKYMSDLNDAMRNPHRMTVFCTPGDGVKTIAKKLGKEDDFSGCYVLLRRDSKPLYVGISRGVIGRLRQHVTGTTHFDATLAYRMASKKVRHGKTQAIAMKDRVFRQAFKSKQRFLKGCTAAFIEIPKRKAVELYLFEAYCAMELNTCEWNTFRTH